MMKRDNDYVGDFAKPKKEPLRGIEGLIFKDQLGNYVVSFVYGTMSELLEDFDSAGDNND
jgi:hypothetical protein